MLGFEKGAKCAPDRVLRGIGLIPLFLYLEPGGRLSDCSERRNRIPTGSAYLHQLTVWHRIPVISLRTIHTYHYFTILPYIDVLLYVAEVDTVFTNTWLHDVTSSVHYSTVPYFSALVPLQYFVTLCSTLYRTKPRITVLFTLLS